MNIITPVSGNTAERKRIQKTSIQSVNHPPCPQVSFKSSPLQLMTAADEKVLKVFSQHYGNVGNRLVTKIDKLMTLHKPLAKTSRFFSENGQMVIKDKSITKSLLENIIFPFITLPLYTVSWVLKRAQSLPSKKIQEGAKKLYNTNIIRLPRKMNEINDKTNMLKGVLGKTRSTVEAFIKEKGLKMSADELIDKLSKADDTPIIKEASDYVKENLYKASNKFFDKHTGNFNTAFERPLNRIVTGLIPVVFLANDAYNLSVLCGDKKEDSSKEAKERTKQEISRVLTTAYIQLLTFGAFTRQVNTISWFTPLTSAATVLFSEISSRKRLGKPIFFLSKDKAKEYNKRETEKNKTSKASKAKGTQQTAAPQAQPVEIKNTNVNTTDKQFKNIISFEDAASSSIFTSFKALDKDDKKAEDKKAEAPAERKALINFNTFKKGVAILIAGGFALSFIKNSSFTRNSKIVKAFKNFGELCKKKIYEPLAYKKFEIKTSEFDDVMGILDDIGCKEIAEGHRFIKNKYYLKNTAVNTGSIMMQKHSISSSGISKVTEQAKAVLSNLSDGDMQKVAESIQTAIKTEGTAVSEMKFEKVAKKAAQIIKDKGINLPDDQLQNLVKTITDAIEKNGVKSCINVDTKLKPFVDIVIEPFKFILSALRLPFKLSKAAIQLLVSPVTKKAEKAALGKAELSKFEKAINRAVTEIFGEKQSKSGKISQTIFANAMEQLQKQTEPYRKAKAALQTAKDLGASPEEISKLQDGLKKAKEALIKYVNVAVEKSFDGVTQSSNKNTDLAMMTKLASSAVTSAFLVADNYNMVMIKSDGEDLEGAKEKANERIIQRLSALFYQSMLINWFNSTFRATYNSSLRGMASVAIPNTITTEILTRKSIGMPIGRKTYEELQENEEKNDNKKGFLGKYFKFMRLLTGKKPLKDRMPKNQSDSAQSVKTQQTAAITTQSTNLLNRYINK